MKATVILPTTAGRGSLIEFSAGSVLRQSIRDIEVFIVGDGVDEETRTVAHALMERDNRVRFFDFPKHSRRGEPYRHEILTNEASGEIVCYLCDRDLMLSNHVAATYRNLKSYDFSSTVIYMIQTDGSIKLQRINFLREVKGEDRNRVGQLSRNGHTMRAYRMLPFGWRTTPANQGTDCYMWKQFLANEDIKANVIASPTILYFKQTVRRNWPVAERCKELEAWYGKLKDEDGELDIHRAAASELYRTNFELTEQVRAQRNQLRRLVNIRGKSPRQIVSRLMRKMLA